MTAAQRRGASRARTGSQLRLAPARSPLEELSPRPPAPLARLNRTGARRGAVLREDGGRRGGEDGGSGGGGSAGQGDDFAVHGRLVKDLVHVADGDARADLESRGYGEVRRGRFYLMPYESLYLMHTGRLALDGRKRAATFDSLVSALRRHDEDVLTRFLVYRDLRARGYAAKGGFGFGADFRVYDRGRFGDKAASYVVFALAEGAPEKAAALHKKAREIEHMGKEPIVAVIERRGEVIYYKLSTVAFDRNGPPDGGGGEGGGP